MVRGPVSYTLFFWVVFTISMVLCVVDRFTTNVWPRQDLHQLSPQAKVSDSDSIRQGPWSVWFDDFFSKLSGRYTMLGLCFLYLTMMHTTHFYLTDTWLNRYVDFGDFVHRIRSHRYLGVSMAVVTITHVWTVTFPAIFSGYSIEVRSGTFVLPLSENKPKGFQHANTTTKVMMMQVDDVYRTILMTLLLGPIVYISVLWMSTNYRLGIRLHEFVMFMYFIDICRRHTHPHCWVFNIPCFLAWLLDTFWGHFFRRQQTAVKRVTVSPNYMIFYWKSTIPGGLRSIADVFYLRAKCGCCKWERSHPFTCLNKRNASISDMRSFVLAKDAKLNITEEDDNWDRAFLMRTYTAKLSHTREMREAPEIGMNIWGGMRFGTIANYIRSEEDVILVGGGSGAMFMLDTLFFLTTHKDEIDEILNVKAEPIPEATKNPKVWFATSPMPNTPMVYPTPPTQTLLFRTSPWVHMGANVYPQNTFGQYVLPQQGPPQYYYSQNRYGQNSFSQMGSSAVFTGGSGYPVAQRTFAQNMVPQQVQPQFAFSQNGFATNGNFQNGSSNVGSSAMFMGGSGYPVAQGAFGQNILPQQSLPQFVVPQKGFEKNGKSPKGSSNSGSSSSMGGSGYQVAKGSGNSSTTIDLQTPTKKKKRTIAIVYTTNDAQLAQWFSNITENIIERNEMPKSVDLQFIIALTGDHSTGPEISWGTVLLGRCDFATEISRLTSESDRECHIFCQGGVSLQNAVSKAAKKNGKTYHDAHSFDNGPNTNKYCCSWL